MLTVAARAPFLSGHRIEYSFFFFLLIFFLDFGWLLPRCSLPLLSSCFPCLFQARYPQGPPWGERTRWNCLQPRLLGISRHFPDVSPGSDPTEWGTLSHSHPSPAGRSGGSVGRREKLPAAPAPPEQAAPRRSGAARTPSSHTALLRTWLLACCVSPRDKTAR